MQGSGIKPTWISPPSTLVPPTKPAYHCSALSSVLPNPLLVQRCIPHPTKPEHYVPPNLVRRRATIPLAFSPLTFPFHPSSDGTVFQGCQHYMQTYIAAIADCQSPQCRLSAFHPPSCRSPTCNRVCIFPLLIFSLPSNLPTPPLFHFSTFPLSTFRRVSSALTPNSILPRLSTGLRSRYRAYHCPRPGQVPPMLGWSRVHSTPKTISSCRCRSSCCCSCSRCCCRSPSPSISRLYLLARPTLFVQSRRLLRRAPPRPPHSISISISSVFALARTQVQKLAHPTRSSIHLPPPPIPLPPSCCSRTASIRISSSISSLAFTSLHTFSFPHLPFLPTHPTNVRVYSIPLVNPPPSHIERVRSHQSRCTMIPLHSKYNSQPMTKLVRLCFSFLFAVSSRALRFEQHHLLVALIFP